MAESRSFISDFFKGLKVIELASVLAGPSAGMFLAELGADVIKIENEKQGGDVTRNWRIPGEVEHGPSAYFSSINFKKEHVFLNLRNEEDQRTCHNYLKEADVVISNYSHRVAQKLKVDLERVRDLNQNVIFVQLNGFFNSERPAYDVVLQAETGWISMTGYPDKPAKLPVALIDVMAGNQIKEAVFMGIIHKMRTKKGSYYEVNLEQVSLSALVNQATNYLMNKHIAQAIGTLHPNIAPYGDWYETLDETRFVLAIGSENQFEQFCEIIGIDISPEISSNTLRVQNRDLLNAMTREKIQKLDYTWLASELNKRNIPFGKIKTLDEVLDSEGAKDMIREEIQEGRLTRRLSTIGFQASSF